MATRKRRSRVGGVSPGPKNATTTVGPKKREKLKGAYQSLAKKRNRKR